ncbi:uncharacterized protein LOC135842744 [Planococcus citri]|uniref:uncharacterized protein LOC135842744 n=1 Tax=Planococcus citri TaxID=170843 RepID=UPI0031F93024
MRRIIFIQISIVILVTFDEMQASTVIDDDVLKDTNLTNSFNRTLTKKINDILETKLKDEYAKQKEDLNAMLKDLQAKLKEDQNVMLKDLQAKLKEDHAKLEQEIKCSLWHLKLDQSIRMLDECCEFFVKNNRPKSRWAAVLPSTLPYDAHFNAKRVPAEVEGIINTLIAVRHQRSHALQKNAGAIEELLKSLETYLNDAIDCNQSDKLERYLPGSIDFITKCLKPENVTSPQHNRKQRLNKKMKQNKRKMQKIPLSFDCQPDGKTTHRQKKNRYLIHLVCNFDVHDVNEFFDRF